MKLLAVDSDTRALIGPAGVLLLWDSYGRGSDRGRSDRESSPFPNPEPLSGEYAGESVRELLGDLIDALVRLGVDESDAFDALCDAYEEGYRKGFGPYPETLSVCPDCFDWFADDSRACDCPPGVVDTPLGVVFDVSGAGESFGRYCDTCDTALAGPRFDVAVFDTREDAIYGPDGVSCADCGDHDGERVAVGDALPAGFTCVRCGDTFAG